MRCIAFCPVGMEDILTSDIKEILGDNCEKKVGCCIFEASDSKETLWPRGWSESKLANDEPVKDAWKAKRDKKDKTNNDEAAVSTEMTEEQP